MLNRNTGLGESAGGGGRRGGGGKGWTSCGASFSLPSLPPLSVCVCLVWFFSLFSVDLPHNLGSVLRGRLVGDLDVLELVLADGMNRVGVCPREGVCASAMGSGAAEEARSGTGGGGLRFTNRRPR